MISSGAFRVFVPGQPVATARQLARDNPVLLISGMLPSIQGMCWLVNMNEKDEEFLTFLLPGFQPGLLQP